MEGVTLQQLKISPYSGDTFHESPLFLSFYRLLISSLSDIQIACFFIAIDVLTAFVLAKVCSAQLNSSVVIDGGIEKHLKTTKKDISISDKVFSELFIQPDTVSTSAFWSIAIYLLSPYSMLSCVAQATSVIGNFLIGLTLLSATYGHRIVALLLLALLSLNSFYPLILLSGVVLILEQKYRLDNQSSADKSKKSKGVNSLSSTNPLHIDITSSSTKFSIFTSILLFFLFYTLLLIASYFLENKSFQFLQSNYVFM